MKKYTLILLCLIASFVCEATDKTTNYIPIMTPESASLGQYGSFPTSLYTGGIDISIPIHTIRTTGISIPIGLQYTGTGFIPNKECGKVGHDWALVAGGAITRTVIGVPDEWIKQDAISDSDPDFELNGMLAYIRSSNQALSNDNIRKLLHLNLIEDGWETTPDLFSFNFCGHSGQFMIDHDSTVKVAGNNFYKVDISNLKPQRLTEPTQISSIVITDGQGTKYTFGGNIYSLEINLKRVPANYETIPNGVIVAFYLTRIETVDGKFVEFQYTDKEDDQNGTYANFDPHDKGHSDGANIIRTPHYTDYYKTIATNNSTSLVFNPADNLAVSYTKTVYLHKIITSFGEDAVFTYENKEIPFFTRAENELWTEGNDPNTRLKDIRITNSCGDIIKYASLHHSYSINYDWHKLSYPSQQTARMFLDSLFINQERYSFEYSTKEKLPLPYTRGIDMQGYYNGNDSISNLLGISATNQTADFPNRQPSTAKASMGMIKKITYPTGGSTEFTFEGHSYGKAVGFSTSGNNIVSLVASQSSGYIGGLRIKQIKNTPGETKSYSYTMSGGGSSGVFNDTKRFNLNIYTDGNGWKPARLIIYSGSNIVAGNTVSEQEVGYSRIVETTGEGNGYKVYTYTTFADFPDEPVLEGNDSTIMYSSSATIGDICSTIHLTSLHIERGKQKTVEEYAANGSLVRESIYEYNSIQQHRKDAIFSCGYRLLLLGKYVGNSVAHYYYPKHVTAVTTREYIGNQYISQRTEYAYNQHNRQISTKQTQNSNGTSVTKKIYYPKDFPADTVLAAMAKANMLDIAVKEESYVSSALEHTREYQFKKYHNKYYDMCAIKETFGTNGSFYPVIIHSRDKHRNIESLTEFGKPAVHYLWGHGYQYPVAKLENITTEEFLSRIPLSTREAIGADFSLESTRTILSSLNGSQYCPNAHVTLFKYKPQVGITNIKTPDEKEMFYNYEHYDRLANIAECNENNIIASYQYNVLHKDHFSAYWQESSSLLFTGTHSLACKTVGGSGNFNYKFSLIRNGVTVASSTTSKLNYNFTVEGNYIFSGTVTDNVTGATASFSNSFAVIEPIYVEFTSIEDHVTVDHGCYSSTAIIECESPITVTFSVMCEVNSNAANTTYGCSIGGYTLTQSSQWPEKTFTVELEAGENIIELYINDLVGTASIELIIEGVEDANAAVGENSYLHLSTDKTN